jgi:hypothetical protein
MKFYSVVLLFLIIFCCKEKQNNDYKYIEYDLKRFVHIGMDERSFNTFAEITNWQPATDIVPRGKAKDTLIINNKKVFTTVYSSYSIFVKKSKYDTLWLIVHFCDFNERSYLKNYCFSNKEINIKNLFNKIESCDSLHNCK